jgi:hypothetical protein
MISKYRIFLILACILAFLGLSNRAVFANVPEFRFYPEEGTIEYGADFTVDVLIDTKGLDVTLARAAVRFDPELAQVKNAQRNDEIFCDWPSNEQVVDNASGLVVATGFCQSGAGDLYSTIEEADVFVRLTFTAVKAGPLILEWDYTGRDEPRKTVIMQDGSPPQNILTVEPTIRTYTINPQVVTKTPETGLNIFDNMTTMLVVTGAIFAIALLANIVLDPKKRYFNKSRTVVVCDDGDK